MSQFEYFSNFQTCQKKTPCIKNHTIGVNLTKLYHSGKDSMTAISQIQMRYLQEEDRFLLRMNTLDESEYRFWFTRRFIKAFYPLLTNTLYATPEIKQQRDPLHKKVMLSFQEENAKNQVEYGTTFATTPKTYPLGKNPLLVCKASIKPLADNNYQLQLRASDDQGLSFTLGQDLLHILAKLILDTLLTTDWQLSFENHLQADSNAELFSGSHLLN